MSAVADQVRSGGFIVMPGSVPGSLDFAVIVPTKEKISGIISIEPTESDWRGRIRVGEDDLRIFERSWSTQEAALRFVFDRIVVAIDQLGSAQP